MKLIYDVAVMAQLVAACQSANTEIVKAEQLVQQVRSHSDWTCKEKSVIDELMQECKSLVQRMREDQSSFLRVLKDVEGELNDTENSVSNLFSGVESILGKVLGIPVATTVAVGGGLLGMVSAIGNTSLGQSATQVWSQWVQNTAIENSMMDQFDPDNAGNNTVSAVKDLIEKLKDIGSDIMDTDVIWHGPADINGIGVGGIMKDVISSGIGVGSGIAEGITNEWNEAWKNNPNLPHNRIDATEAVLPSRMTEWFQDQISYPWEQTDSGMADGLINDIKETFVDIHERAEQVVNITGTTAYPHGQIHPPVSDVLKDAWGNIGDVVTPIVSPVTDVVSGVWTQVQDSPIGDAVQDALRNITENIAICSMSDLKL